jgi:rod shape-determining protein MreC
MFDSQFLYAASSDQPLAREGPQLHAFLASHRAFFILMGALIAQLLLLSVQITRDQHVRLIRVWTVSAIAPFERSLGGVLNATTQAWKTYGRLWHAQQENQELHLQLASAQMEIHRLSEAAAEAQRLRTLLDFKGQLPYQTMAAEVIASSPGANSNALYIDKGSASGLVEDLPVITPAGVVGKIIAVFPHTSHVLLINDPSSGVGVMLTGSRIQGVLKGAAPKLCQLLYIMNEQPVSPGEAIETSGLDKIYPKGLPVGTIVEAVLVVLRPPPDQTQATNQPNHP